MLHFFIFELARFVAQFRTARTHGRFWSPLSTLSWPRLMSHCGCPCCSSVSYLRFSSDLSMYNFALPIDTYPMVKQFFLIHYCRPAKRKQHRVSLRDLISSQLFRDDVFHVLQLRFSFDFLIADVLRHFPVF